MPQISEQQGIDKVGERVNIVRAVPSLAASFWSQVATLHRQEIRGGFLSSLNPRFLESIYRSIARGDKAFLLAATDTKSARVLGFICGSTDSRRTLMQCLSHSGIGLFFAVLPNACSFQTVRKMLESVRYASARPSDTLPRAEILNFCVDRNVQGQGIGRLLFRALRTEFRDRGVQSIKIVTGASQEKAQRFYRAMNAQLVDEVEVHKGTGSLIFVYSLD